MRRLSAFTLLDTKRMFPDDKSRMSMKTVKMHGPSISDPSKMVNRDVPECDVVAYQAAGYVEGSLPEEEAEQAEPKTAPKVKGKSKAK